MTVVRKGPPGTNRGAKGAAAAKLQLHPHSTLRRGSSKGDRYQLLPPLRPEEREALRVDIAARGVLVPVEIDAATGAILDGHHRAAIAAELGIDFPRVKRRFNTETERVEHVLKLNLLRRHLGPVAWASAFRRLVESRGLRLGQGQRNDRRAATSDTVAEVARELGVEPRTARRRLQIAHKLEGHPDLAERVDHGELEARRAVSLVRQREAASRPQPKRSAIPADVDLRLGDFRTVLADVAEASVDLIYTDPPYIGESMPIYADLSAFTARVLKPEGLLLCEVGVLYLPQAIGLLSERLDYRWCVSLYQPGKHPGVHTAHVVNGWRPLLVFVRADHQPSRWIMDTFTVDQPPDKVWHPWQKSVQPARYYIGKLTDSRALVLDPFLGSGSNAVAACQLGRRFIGAEIDRDTWKIARVRLAEEASG